MDVVTLLVSDNQFRIASILGDRLLLYILNVSFWLPMKHLVPLRYACIFPSVHPVVGTVVFLSL